MNTWHELTPGEWDPAFDRIGKDWMLISASDGEWENTMTASWGGIGVVWNQPVAVCLIRPERFTFALADRAERLSLAFLPDGYRDALKFCGRESGRDYPDKFTAAGLTVAHEGAASCTPMTSARRASLTPPFPNTATTEADTTAFSSAGSKKS